MMGSRQLFPQYLHSLVFEQHFNRPPDIWAKASVLDPHIEEPVWLTAIHCTTMAALLLAISASAVLRLVAMYKARQGGTIKLDLDSKSGERPLTRQEALAETLLDKMDHGLGEDGEAIGVPAFWRNVRLRKAIVTVLLIALCALQIFRLVRFPYLLHASTLSTTGIAVELATYLYLVLLLPFYAFASTIQVHRQMTFHFFWLSIFLVLHYYFVTQGPALAIGYAAIPHWTTHYALGLPVSFMIACGAVSLGPGRFRERSRLYNKAISDKLREAGETVEPNVLGVDASILGKFLAFPTNDMIRHVVSVDQVDLDELPVLPASMQQQPSVLDSVRWKSHHGGTWFGPTVSLLFEVWGPQWVGWLQALFCLFIETGASYIPHLCIQQILFILDRGSARRSAGAYAALWLISQQVESISYITRTWDLNFFHVDRRMRAHLSYILYRKLLTRSTYSLTDETARTARRLQRIRKPRS